MSDHSQSIPALNTPTALSRRQCWLLATCGPLFLLPACSLLPMEQLTFGHCVLILLLTAATVTDLRQRKIFNWATYPALGWGLLISLPGFSRIAGPGSIGLAASLSGATLCFGLMLCAYTLARGGAGDVKLAAAIGALLGPDAGVLVIAFTYIIAGLAIIGWTIQTRGPLVLCAALARRLGATVLPARVQPPSEQQTLLLDRPVPLAGFFAIGTACVVLDLPAMLRGVS